MGTVKWPCKLAKQRFEGDTIYNLTFRDAKNNYASKLSTQGFFIFELKAFGDALQTALSVNSGYDVHFKDGTIETVGSESSHRGILVRFTTGTGSFITTERNAIKLIYAIKREAGLDKKSNPSATKPCEVYLVGWIHQRLSSFVRNMGERL